MRYLFIFRSEIKNNEGKSRTGKSSSRIYADTEREKLEYDTTHMNRTLYDSDKNITPARLSNKSLEVRT